MRVVQGGELKEVRAQSCSSRIGKFCSKGWSSAALCSAQLTFIMCTPFLQYYNSEKQREISFSVFADERVIWSTSDEGASVSFARMCRLHLLAWKFVQYFLKRTLYLICQSSIELTAIYVHSFEIFKTEMGETAFCTLHFIIIKSNYFQNAQKGECFLDDFRALVREIDVRG
jgi:hypothetical protein